MKRNVLVFPAGTEIGLEIHEALRNCKDVALFGAGSAVKNHGAFAYSQYHVLPTIFEEGWLDALVQLCRELAIDYIFPAYDDIIVALANNASSIPATILSAELGTCLTTRSKRATYLALQDIVRVPVMFASADAVTEYPVLVKPDQSQGSQGIVLAKDRTQLIAAIAATNDPVLCEWLPGQEYTIDCFSDRERGVLFAGARVRNRMRNGIAVNTTTVDLPEVASIAAKISDAFQMRGAWFFQLKRAADHGLALLEVAPRIAGSMSAHRVQGINFPLLTIYESERIPVSVIINKSELELDRALSNRYKHTISFSSLYIDLDDTLILNDQVNLDAIALVFKTINRGAKVHLLTRHSGDLAATLEKYRLGGLFDTVIHIDRSKLKSDYITDDHAIFVDDSFAERLDVATRKKIPTFDLTMIGMLINS